MKTYSKVNEIPSGKASGGLTAGCLILEGGAWRGIYTQGALDAMMQEGVNIQTTIGVSAGAMSGLAYVAGQIGRSARFNLTYRHDDRYMGRTAMHDNHGITGFQFVFSESEKIMPLDQEAFNDPARRFVVTGTDIETGRNAFFEKGKTPDMYQAIRASATVPYVSEPVEVEGRKYLDGGIACKIPLNWALEQDFEKIMIIRTRDRKYRKTPHAVKNVVRMEYGKYPELLRDLEEEAPNYNLLLDRIDSLEREGRIHVLAPEEPINIGRFEGNMEKLGELYWRGYNDARADMESMKAYFGITE